MRRLIQCFTVCCGVSFASSSLHAQAAVVGDSVIVANERAMWNALKARDTTAFAKAIGGVVDVDLYGARNASPSSVSRYVLMCQTTNVGLSMFHIAHTVLTATVTYTAAVEQTCNGVKAPSPVYVLTVYEHRGADWVPVAHSETAAAKW
jgi:hypothetical protein